MDDRLLLRRIIGQDEAALEELIRRYSAYVITVIHNRSRGILSPEDEEEIASDVFFTLWCSAGKIRSGAVRSWLGAVARNSTADRLRNQKINLSLEEQTAGEDTLWESFSKTEQTMELEKALRQLKPQDREIFYRHYDLCQTSIEIAEEMELKPTTVRTRLKRGRQQLTHLLCQGGFAYEKEN